MRYSTSQTPWARRALSRISIIWALEGELARAIRGLDRVAAARVHLVLPERPLFSRDKAEPSASVVLKVHRALEPQQVRAIRHLVASAVNGLKPQRVSIVDETGRLLADGTGNDELGEVTVDERRASFEKRLREQVEAIVSSVVGSGRTRIQVSADFDFNRMGAMGPVRLRDVDEAQVILVNLAKDLAAKGEIVISKTRSKEELIY